MIVWANTKLIIVMNMSTIRVLEAAMCCRYCTILTFAGGGLTSLSNWIVSVCLLSLLYIELMTIVGSNTIVL